MLLKPRYLNGLRAEAVARQGLTNRQLKLLPLMAEGLPTKRITARNWSIDVKSGRYSGTSHVLDRLPGYRQRQVVRIGRDPNWSDIVLDREERVSGQHTVIRLGRGGWQIMDYGGGRGSSNKTYVGTRAIHPNEWTPISQHDTIRIANVEISLVP